MALLSSPPCVRADEQAATWSITPYLWAATFDGTIGLPGFGLGDTPIQTYNAPRYIEMSAEHKMPPNMVSAVLADFRGYDTLGETTVILTAGLSVLLLLRGRPRKLDDAPEPEDKA